MSYKIFFTTDIHGSDRCFRKFINAAKFYNVQTVILGGDITGKAIVPVIQKQDGQYSAILNNSLRKVSKSELTLLEKEIRFNGYYPYLTSEEELARINRDSDGKNRLFRDAIRNCLQDWFTLAEERLKPAGISVYISPGNDDDSIVDEVLGSSDFIINPEEQVVEITHGIEMMTFGYSNPTPWNSPRELDEEIIAEKLNNLAGRMSYQGVSIFNIHVPPYNTPLDQAPKLDESLKPIVQGGQIAMAGCGSTSVRSMIEQYQPTVALHGHVHESSGAFRLKKTICINPGSEYNDGILRGAILTIEEKKKKVLYQLTVG